MDYRTKIYKYYLTNSVGKSVPDSVENFKSSAPFLNKIIKDHFPADKQASILEVGCGYGIFQYYINRAGYVNSLGIDRSEEQVASAHNLGIKNVKQEDLLTYINNCESNSIDVIIAFDVLEHFGKEELSQIVDKFYRVLKPGGQIICHTPNGEGTFGSSIRYGDFTHELSFSRKSIAQLFLSSGFSKASSFEDKPVVHGLKSMVRYFLWQYLIRNIYRILIIIECGGCDRNTIFTKNFLSVAIK
jgi:SAM-dependent methyltransferase